MYARTVATSITNPAIMTSCREQRSVPQEHTQMAWIYPFGLSPAGFSLYGPPPSRAQRAKRLARSAQRCAQRALRALSSRRVAPLQVGGTAVARFRAPREIIILAPFPRYTLTHVYHAWTLGWGPYSGAFWCTTAPLQSKVDCGVYVSDVVCIPRCWLLGRASKRKFLW